MEQDNRKRRKFHGCIISPTQSAFSVHTGKALAPVIKSTTGPAALHTNRGRHGTVPVFAIHTIHRTLLLLYRSYSVDCSGFCKIFSRERPNTAAIASCILGLRPFPLIYLDMRGCFNSNLFARSEARNPFSISRILTFCGFNGKLFKRA